MKQDDEAYQAGIEEGYKAGVRETIIISSNLCLKFLFGMMPGKDQSYFLDDDDLKEFGERWSSACINDLIEYNSLKPIGKMTVH